MCVSVRVCACACVENAWCDIVNVCACVCVENAWCKIVNVCACVLLTLQTGNEFITNEALSAAVSVIINKESRYRVLCL